MTDPMRTFEKFEVLEIPLTGSNLVEASAGTGKTYSIAILALRLILEEEIPASKILMVTFTNKAVGELADRVRKFLKKGLKYLQDNQDQLEPEIKAVIDEQSRRKGKDKIELLLKTAIFSLDEAPIQTIDSFAGECLNTYAFETDQQFGQEVLTDFSDILNSQLEDFWRKEISGLHPELINFLGGLISFDTFRSVLNNRMKGLKYVNGEVDNQYLITQYEERLAEIGSDFRKNRLEYLQRVEIGVAAKYRERIRENFRSTKSYIDFLTFQGSTPQYKRNFIDDHFTSEKVEASFLLDQRTAFVEAIFHRCMQRCKEIITRIKGGNQITYDQIIKQLNKKVKENDRLCRILRERYQAVFIDEFQDTNKAQYEVYHKVFGKESLIFYIGDPKQSIYGFRGADLYSYNNAAKEVDHRYTMKLNFRSSDKMTKALNVFFQPEENFDTFLTVRQIKEDDPKLDINYIQVSSGGVNKGSAGIEGPEGPLEPMRIFSDTEYMDLPGKVVTLVKNLLDKEKKYTLNGKAIQPSDIGILSRLTKDGNAVKAALDAVGIPSVTVNDSKIFASAEARNVLYILQALEEPKRGAINRALLNDFTGISRQDLLTIDDDKVIDQFISFKEVWEDHGVYAMLRNYMDVFGVVHFLMTQKESSGLRSLSNFTQLAEVLQQAELHKELGISGLIKYLTRQLGSPDAEGDEYEQRIESDEDAIKIYNIHKAKGLEFPIVIAPNLDLYDTEFFEFNTFRDHSEEAYKFYHKDFREEEAREYFELQLSQENRRLIYVALTRAQYNSFVFRKPKMETSLGSFVSALEKNHEKEGYIKIAPFDFDPEAKVERSGSAEADWGKARELSGIELKDRNWRKMSFSSLSSKGPSVPKENSNLRLEGYEQFIFNEMKGGTQMGNLLHEVFENIEFTANDENAYDEVLRARISKYYPSEIEKLLSDLRLLISYVLNARIEFSEEEAFTLKELKEEDKVPELEFDFLTQPISLSQLKAIPGMNGYSLYHKNLNFKPEGLLTGFIDLLFRKNGKFYILDWKSNYLGDKIEHYEKEGMTAAMNQNNYHMQYLFYTLAVKKFLNSRLGENFDYSRDFGGVIYMFLRGNRAGETSGVFTTKPTLEQVQFLEDLMTPVT